MKTLLILSVLFYLTACSSGEAPTKQWEMAVQGVYSASLSKDGGHILVGSVHHGGSFWEVDRFERLYNWNHEAEKMTGVLASAISDNMQYAATAEHRKIVLWNAQTGEPFWLWEAPADIRDMDLSNDGRYALLGMENYEGALFDIQNGGVRLRLAHDGIVQTVDMSEDMAWGITGDDDSKVKVWNLRDGKEVHSWELQNQIKVVAINRDGRLAFASSHRSENYIWDLSTGRKIAELPVTRGYFLSARFDDKSQHLLTGNSSGQVQLWKVKGAELLRTWALKPRNSWVTNNTQVLDVAFGRKDIRAVGANGITYQLK